MPDLICRQEDNGKTVELKKGQILEVDLKENPTTGYKWAEANFDENLLELQRSEFRLPKDSGMGAGGVRYFQFIAKSPGQTSISLINKRPWESPEAAAAKFTIAVKIAN